MPAMQWSAELELGLVPMDATHQEFVALYNALESAGPDTLVECFDAFIAHTEAHFEQENGWMAAVDFPGCHRAEHDRVLAVIRDVRQRLAQGDGALARRLIEELPPWFESHAGGMDAALAHHLATIGFDFATGCAVAPAGGCGERAAGACSCTGAAA